MPTQRLDNENDIRETSENHIQEEFNQSASQNSCEKGLQILARIIARDVLKERTRTTDRSGSLLECLIEEENRG
jgi:hypothetical protein